MIEYVQVTVDGVLYHLGRGSDGRWRITNRAPRVAGEYSLAITLGTEDGNSFTIDYDDPALAQALRLLVLDQTTVSGQRMLDYYPYVIKVIREFQALMLAEGFEVDFMEYDAETVLSDAFLGTMSESRIEEWERALSISHKVDDTLYDRRENVIATIRGSGKLNTNRIDSIVQVYTGLDADSYFEDSTIYVKINAPLGNKQYKFTNLEQALIKKKPAHLNLVVTRNYSIWDEVKADFDSWQDLYNWVINDQAATWDDVKHYVST